MFPSIAFMSFFKIHGGNLGADKVGFDFAIIVLCWFFHQPDEEEAAKLEFHEWL